MNGLLCFNNQCIKPYVIRTHNLIWWTWSIERTNDLPIEWKIYYAGKRECSLLILSIIHPSVRPFIYPPIHPSIHSSIHSFRMYTTSLEQTTVATRAAVNTAWRIFGNGDHTPGVWLAKWLALTPTWFEHATFWSGVRRATVEPRSLTYFNT